MYYALVLVATQKLSLTSSAASIAADPSRERLLRVISDQPFHVSTSGNVATTSDAYVPPQTEMIVAVAPTLSLSIVKAVTATADSSVWLSEVKRV